MPRSSARTRTARTRTVRTTGAHTAHTRTTPTPLICARWCVPVTQRSVRHVARLALLGVLVLAPGCAGRCPDPVVDPASVTSTALPCQPGVPARAVAGDPLTLVGGSGLIFVRFDIAAMRRSAYGEALQRAFDWFVRAEVRGREGEAMRSAMERTEVIAFSVEPEHGFVFVAQGRYTEADTETFELPERTQRREHIILSRSRHAVSVARGGRYFVLAEGVGVEAVLDRLDGLEDPAPVGGAMLAAASTMSAYQSYFSIIGIPASMFRREFEREEGLEGIFGDLRWAALSVTQGSDGVDVNGRVHTISERAANAILNKSLDVQREATVALDREVPVLAEAGRAVSMTVTGTDATLSLRADDARSRAMIQAVSDAFERDAQRRSSYSTSATATP